MAGRRPKPGEEPKPAKVPQDQKQSPSPDQRRRYNAYVKKQFAGSQNPDVMDMSDWVKVNR